MLTAAVVACSFRLPAILAVVATLSFAALIRATWRDWTPVCTFGLANTVTTARLVLVLGSLMGALFLPAWLLALLSFVGILFDGVDGWAARRFGTQGDFGARYDVAVDSVFALALSVVLIARDLLGPWVLVAGIWHYVYVLAPVVYPTDRAEARRSRWGCTVFIAVVGSLAAAFVIPEPWASSLVVMAMAAQSASFLLSFWERYGPERTLAKIAREASPGLADAADWK